ncbi:hypothetical protein PWP93_27565 [Paraburkholderia sp. A1RI-2L]|uniref:hypothetical protein n=1 Tax=Paraburkholderia sp. A1RI-2L TaxID=3028367 RepID=UPI003B821B46
MRVMLDVKSALYGEACAYPVADHEPLLFKATLRAPVLRDRPYQLHIEPSGSRFKFSVVDDISGKSCISGYLRPASEKEAAVGDATVRDAESAPPFLLEKDELAQQMTHFISMVGQAQPAWLILDALLFRHLLVNESELFGGVARVFGVNGVNSASALMSDVAVLQTHHETLIPAPMKLLMLDGLLDDMGAMGLHIEVGLPAMTGDASSGLAITGSLVARISDAMLTRTSIGLLALPPFLPAVTGV